MNVLITGIDGYLGWSLAQHLLTLGYDVVGIDSFARRAWVEEMGGTTAIPIADMAARRAACQEVHGRSPVFYEGDLLDADFVSGVLHEHHPDTIVHLGECPSAPYSMIDRDHAVYVQRNNVVGTFNVIFGMREACPEAHLVKLGTMGEYGTPDVDIPEGFFEVEYRGRRDRLPFPRQAGSWYHWSKVHGSNNIMFACKVYGLRATDVMQGIVFGTPERPQLDPRLATRLDFDQAFGTAVNRFCCQAVLGHPITVYGLGRQCRGFIPLADSMQCLTLAIEHPPAQGEYRVFNQFENTYQIADLADRVRRVASSMGWPAEVRHVENPRDEMATHYYSPDHRRLLELGYEPTRALDHVVAGLLRALAPHKDRIAAHAGVLIPDVRWRGSRSRVPYLTTIGV